MCIRDRDLYGDYFNVRDTIRDSGSPAHVLDQQRDNFGLTFLPGFDEEDAWRESTSDIANSRFYQVRMTFLGNAVTGQAAEVAAFALTWQQ